jgi:hypothetical protein
VADAVGVQLGCDLGHLLVCLSEQFRGAVQLYFLRVPFWSQAEIGNDDRPFKS